MSPRTTPRFRRSTASRATRGAVLGCPFGGLATEMSGDDDAARDRAAGYIAKIHDRIGDALAEAARDTGMQGMAVADATDGLSAQFQGAGVLAVARNDPSAYLRLSESVDALARAYV